MLARSSVPLLCLFASCTFLLFQRNHIHTSYEPNRNDQSNPIHPTTIIPPPPQSRPPILQTPNMDPTWIGFPQPTYQPGPPRTQHPNNDVEQQAGLTASDPASQNTVANGQNSVRTRVFSGVLMVSVIALVVIILVTTSGHHVKSSRHHAVKSSRL